MGIGLIIVVFNPAGGLLRSKGTSSAANLRTNKKTEEGKPEEAIKLMSTADMLTPSVSPSPTPSPEPTPLPVYPLEEKGYPSEIDELVKTYYEAKVICDINTLKSISTNPENVISKEQLLMLVEGIEKYRNIKCYVKKSYEEGAYIVFVYYDIKFIGIRTLAPSLSKLYIVTNEEGKLKTFDGELTEELRDYLAVRSNDEDVRSIKAHTDQLTEEAKEKDKELKAFWEMLDRY